jgi:uncharacterized lipoprotein YddW (UPF0748 family)/N-acetylmuramoyl-L-alanine amidase
MKKLICFLLTFVLVFAFSPVLRIGAASVPTDEDFRAVWVSSVVNLDFPSKPGLSVGEMKAEIDKTVSRAADLGLNAVVFQARPAADALYKSNIFPWSEYLTGVQGQAPADGFDPLAYIIEKCHERSIELHAWVNPYRVSHSASKRVGVSQLADGNPAKANPTWVVKYEGGLYFNPGLPECRELIIKGIEEILQNYDIDGIHMDDYFYPGSDFSDSETYKKYGSGMDLGDWRRENVNILLRGIRDKIKEVNPNVSFGISPFAIWQNKASSELGSDTNGFEAYKSIYSDTRHWVKEGYLDYICPQIYWYIGFNAADYETLLNWWIDVCRGTGVDLFIGHAAYREAANEDGWSGEILRQLKMNEANPEVTGSIFFRSAHLTGKLGDQIKGYYEAKPRRPAGTGEANGSGSSAASDTGMANGSGGSAANGSGTSNGSGGSAANGSGTANGSGGSAATPSDLANLPLVMSKLSVAQPAKDITVSSAKGYTILGTCLPGKDVYINGYKIANRTAEGFFSAYVSLAAGKNTFTIKQDGQESVTRTITQKAPASSPSAPAKPVGITEIAPQENYYATVTEQTAWVYPKNSTSGGSSSVLEKGAKDLITAKTDDGKWVKLSSGYWLETLNANCAYEGKAVSNVLSGGVYEKGEDTDTLKWAASAYPAVVINFDGDTLDVNFGLQTSVPQLNTGDLANTVFADVQSGMSGKTPYYSFKLKGGVKTEGFYAEYKNGEFTINIKKRKSVSQGDLPLKGLKIMLDAGHGDTDTGALGPMGLQMPEKNINLVYSNKLASRLEKLGAQVISVRTNDVFYTLNERTQKSRDANPDLFISLHCNSIAETTDSSTIRGLTIWYKNALAEPFAALLADKTGNANPGTTRSKVLNSSNFYVCRPAWTPSVIVETSFMCNIRDFSWLVSENNQNELADKIADAVVEYYR